MARAFDPIEDVSSASDSEFDQPLVQQGAESSVNSDSEESTDSSAVDAGSDPDYSAGEDDVESEEEFWYEPVGLVCYKFSEFSRNF